MSDPPRRLLDDAAAPGGLRDDLALARAAPPVTYDAGAGLARLKSALGGAASAAAVGSGTLKLTLIAFALAGAVAAIGLVTVIASGGETRRAAELPAQTPAVTPAQTPPPPPPPTTTPTPTPTPAVTPPLAVPAPAITPVPRATPRPRAVTRPPPVAAVDAADPDEGLRREIAQLADGRHLLINDPAAALALVDAGQREFATGMFAEERAAIAIFALDKLGRREEARHRAERFVRRYPAGSFSHRVRALIHTPTAGAP